MDVTIPPGATAQVYVPASDITTITENGMNISQVNGSHLFGVPGGSYRFESTMR
jgi:hypothetical protein